MTHMETRSTSAFREYQIAVLTGGIYGAVHTISGHGLDNMKARMQLDKSYRGLGVTTVAKQLWRAEGLRGFTRGMTAPLLGSTMYRSVMMSSFELVYTYIEVTRKGNNPAPDWWSVPLPYTAGLLRPSVVASTVIAATARSIVEGPFEYTKTMYQVGRGSEVRLKDMYRGQLMQTLRTTSMLLLIFVPYDYVRRETTLFNPAPADPNDPNGLPDVKSWAMAIGRQGLVIGSVCSCAYAMIWPLETLKNLTQAGLPRPQATLYERLNHLSGGRGFVVRSLFTGAVPGILMGGIRNGCAAMAMASANRYVSVNGMRDE